MEDYQKSLAEALSEWRKRHRLREDDAVLLLVELLMIHQKHWDQLRSSELPSFEQLRGNIDELTASARIFQQQASALIDRLQRQPITKKSEVSLCNALFATGLAALAGYLFARVWL